MTLWPRLPLYRWIRLFFLSYTVLPQTQYAEWFYGRYVESFLTHNEQRIENTSIYLFEYVKRWPLVEIFMWTRKIFGPADRSEGSANKNRRL